MKIDPNFAGRIEGPLKVTGAACFEGETPAEGLLHAALVEAPIAHGRLTAIDAHAARAVPGFVDCVTRAEAADLKPSPATALIQGDTIHFPGQAVAMVIAETGVAAREAAGKIVLAYDEAAAVPTIHHPDAQPFAPEMAGARARAASSRGDPEAALAAAAHIVGGRFATAANNHHPMEPHACVVWWEEGRMVAHTCTQAVFGTRNVLAHAFQMPRENIRVVSKFLGGGFGCKGQLWFPWLIWALVAARRTGRPVKLELTRAQLTTLVGRRSETVQDIAVAADKAGTLTAIEHRVMAQTSTHAPDFCDPTAAVSRLTYACANVVTGHRIARTHEPQPIPMRGPGEAPGSFALEVTLDELAERLNLDPVDLRLRNLAPHDQESGLPWSSNGLAECLRRGAQSFGWHTRRLRGWRDGGQRLGWGMATASYPARRQPATMRLRLAGDGSVEVACGTQDMGSGTYSLLAQLAAEGLNLPLSQIRVVLGDTDLPEGPISAGSQVTQSVAPAMAGALADLRRNLATLVVDDPAFAGAAADDLELSDTFVRRRASNAAARLSDLLATAGADWIEGHARAPGMPDEPTATPMGFGAVFAEVAVDAVTAEIRVRRLTGAYAAGRIVNPTLARGQYVGGLVGGIGMALHEDTRTDPRTGRILNRDFAEYLIPTHADMPAFDIIMVEEVDDYVAEGVKGVGMLGHVGTAAAIANAVYQATGRRVRHLPIRVEDLL